jgi:prevent-host-death family protein
VKVVSEADMKAQPGTYLKEVEAGPVVVTRKGKPVAVLLAVKDEDDLESLLLGHSAPLQAILQRSRQQVRAGAGVSHDTFWQDLSDGAPPPAPRRRRKKPG